MRMINRKAVTIFLAMSFGGLTLVYGFERLITAAIRSEKDFLVCKTFVMNNGAVAREFGSIQRIRLRGSVGGRRFAHTVSGYYNFCVVGTERRGYLRVSWTYDNNDVVVTHVSTPACLFKHAVLWPEDHASSPKCLLPSHVWYGLGYLLSAFVSALLAVCVLSSAKVSSRFAGLIRNETTRGVVLLAILLSLVYEAVMSCLWFLRLWPVC